jgi:hypothetical protein
MWDFPALKAGSLKIFKIYFSHFSLKKKKIEAAERAMKINRAEEKTDTEKCKNLKRWI